VGFEMEFDLRPLRADSAHLLPQLVAEFLPGGPRTEVIRVSDEIVARFHLLAAGALLIEGDAQKFFLHLIRCAENGLRVLRLLERRGLERTPASRNVPLLGALATGDFDRATAIARLSRDARDLGSGEYEDEFLMARVFQLLAVPRPGGADIGPLLDRLDELDLATYGDRTAAVRALLATDAPAFEAAITGAALQYELVTEERAKSFTTPVTSFAPHRFLWLEGLALLRLGERAGVRVKSDLKLCPRLARLPMTARYEGDWAIEIDGG
jgi:hypothetical protein